MKNAVFIGATGQNVGKTTLCLGLIAALKKRFNSVGFIKPVGQQHVRVEEGLDVDKDVQLFKKHFSLPSTWRDMSPVIIPKGYTRAFLDGDIDAHENLIEIQEAFQKISSQNAFTVVEGTGHLGVGEIVALSNAKVASLLGLDMIIIAEGGIGSAIDQLALNIALCQTHGVKVRGVILNCVKENKREMVLDYFPRALKRWNIPLLGCVPFNKFLSTPTMSDYEQLFGTELLSGRRWEYRHFQDIRLVAGSVSSYREEMVPNQLIITPTSREDIIRETIRRHEEAHGEGSDYEGGMILTGRNPPSEAILREIKEIDLPILYAPSESYRAMKAITQLIAKTRLGDLPKIEQIIGLVERNLNVDTLIQSSTSLSKAMYTQINSKF